MQSSELRVQNLVKRKSDGLIYKVVEILEYTVTIVPINGESYFKTKDRVIFEDIEPIPLTPEILEKAGFKQAISNDKIWLLRIGDTNLMLRDGEAWSYVGPIPLKINYVHQLQNLIFALTGTELTINL